jgi:tetratricopeptide (TPR) repeat protein
MHKISMALLVAAGLATVTCEAAPQSVASQKTKPANHGPDSRSVDELLLALELRGDDSAVTPLLRLATPEKLEYAKAGLELAAAAGALDGDWLRMVMRDFDLAVEDPGYVVAQRGPARITKPFTTAWSAFENQADGLRSLETRNPVRYLLEYDMLLQQAQLLVAASPQMPQLVWYGRDIASRYGKLGSFARFAANDVPKALALFERAQKLSDALPSPSFRGIEIRLARADALRFAADDPAGALKLYQEVLQAMPKGPPRSLEIKNVVHVLERWLPAEIAWLENGTRIQDMEGWQSKIQPVIQFSGVDPVFAQLRAAFNVNRKPGAAEREDLARKLESLSASHGRLIDGFNYLPVLGSPERIAAYMRKHDPAGFISAQLIGRLRLYDGVKTDNMPVTMNIMGWDAGERDLVNRAVLLVSHKQ